MHVVMVVNDMLFFCVRFTATSRMSDWYSFTVCTLTAKRRKQIEKRPSRYNPYTKAELRAEVVKNVLKDKYMFTQVNHYYT